MAKTTKQFICQNCGAAFSKWSGKCLNCGEWDTLVESLVTTPTGADKRRGSVSGKLALVKLAQVDPTDHQRLSTGLGEVDAVLGGGLVPGSLVLLSGDPGIGKSTLVLQMAAQMSQRAKVLYVSGEESAGQIKLRAERLHASDSDLDFVATTDIDNVLSSVASSDYQLVIIDSIQTMASQQLSSAPGTVSQITNNANAILQTAKSTKTSFIVIGHVTKEGNVAGPKILEHLVDTVLYLEGERMGMLKLLRAVKNRFGSTNEVGILEMTERGMREVPSPSAAMLAEKQALPGSVVFAAIEGTRALLVEVQALVSPSVFGYPKRTADGVDLNRLSLLAAVITKHGGINLSSSDIYVNIVGGLKVTEPAVDLAIILAIASAYKNITVAPDLVVFGEVGLSGELRSVSMSDQRLSEAKRIGFSAALVPPTVKSQGAKPVAHIKAAIDSIKTSK